MLLFGMKEPVPTAWVPAESCEPALPAGVTHHELALLARYQHTRTTISQLAWSGTRGSQDDADPPQRDSGRNRRPAGAVAGWPTEARRRAPTASPAADLRALPVKGTVR
jgi:hypothetical protein